MFATVDCVLRRNTLRMKQVYRVPFVRNSDRVKQLCYDYVQVSHIHFHNWLRSISTDTLLYCICKITVNKYKVQPLMTENIFLNINTVSLATVDHVLRRNTLRMKQVYRVPFDRNSDRAKQLCYDYVQVSHIHFHNWLRPISTDTLLYCIVIHPMLFSSVSQHCVGLFLIQHFTFFFLFLLTVLAYILLFVLCKSFTHSVVFAVMYRLQHFWKK